MGAIIADSSSEYKLPMQFRPCVNRPNMYKSIFDGSYLVHYQKLISKKDFAQQHEHFQFRKCNSDQLLSPKYFSSDTAAICSLSAKVHYFFSTIDYTFAEIISLKDIIEAFTTIIECLRGAEILARRYGYFKIRQEMVFCCEGKTKIWISENPLQNQIQSKVNSKKQFVQQVIKMIDSKISKTLVQQYQLILKQYRQSRKNTKQTLVFNAKIIRNGFFSCLLNEHLNKDQSIENMLYFLFKKLKEIQDASFQKQNYKIENVSLIDKLDNLGFEKSFNKREDVLTGQNLKIKMFQRHQNRVIQQNMEIQGQLNVKRAFQGNKQQMGDLTSKLQTAKINNQSKDQYQKSNKFSLKNLNNQNITKNSWHSIYSNFDQCTGGIELQNKKQKMQKQDRQALEYQTCYGDKAINEEDRRTIKTNSRKNSDLSANMNRNSQPRIQDIKPYQQKVIKTIYLNRIPSKKQLLTSKNQQLDAKQSIRISQNSIKQRLKELQIQAIQTSIHKISNTENFQKEQRQVRNKNQQNIRDQKNNALGLNFTFQSRFLSQIQQESNYINTSQRDQRPETVAKSSQNLNSEQSSLNNKLLAGQTYQKQDSGIAQIEQEQHSTIIETLQESQVQSQNFSNSNPQNEKLELGKNRVSIEFNLVSPTLEKTRSQSQQKQNYDSNNSDKILTNVRTFDNSKKNKKYYKSRFSQFVASNCNNQIVPNFVKTRVSRQSQQVKALKRFTITDKQGQDPLVLIKQTELIQLMKNMVKTRSPFRKLTTIESIPGTQEQQYSYIDEGQQYDYEEEEQQRDSENTYFN